VKNEQNKFFDQQSAFARAGHKCMHTKVQGYINAQAHVYTSVKYVRNVQILWCDCH